MCGRFTASFEFREIKIRWDLQRDLSFAPRYNIAPTQKVPVIFTHDGANEVREMYWGLVPSWAKDKTMGISMINTRAETLAEKTSSKRLLTTRRCLIPATGFYEWRKQRNRKTPVWIHLKTKQPFAFAGLWKVWRMPQEETFLESFTIITIAANDFIKPIHERMPVILLAEDEKGWINSKIKDAAEILSLLKPYPADLLNCHEVSSLVNSATEDRPECIDAVPIDTDRSQLSLI
jgi:putative SOS response-associated peptidase YedK